MSEETYELILICANCERKSLVEIPKGCAWKDFVPKNTFSMLRDETGEAWKSSLQPEAADVPVESGYYSIKKVFNEVKCGNCGLPHLHKLSSRDFLVG